MSFSSLQYYHESHQHRGQDGNDASGLLTITVNGINNLSDPLLTQHHKGEGVTRTICSEHMRVCERTCIHAKIHTDIQTDKQTDRQGDRQIDTHTYIHTYIPTQAYIHTYIHACMHTYKHAYILNCIRIHINIYI